VITDPQAHAQFMSDLYQAVATKPRVRAVVIHTLHERAQETDDAKRGLGLIRADQWDVPKDAFCMFDPANVVSTYPGC
jgi:hypothetical protein